MIFISFIPLVRPFVRKLIQKFDFEALDVKMSKAKGLFYLMSERSSTMTPHGYVTVESMAVELSAGGISSENVNYVREQFFFKIKIYPSLSLSSA